MLRPRAQLKLGLSLIAVLIFAARCGKLDTAKAGGAIGGGVIVPTPPASSSPFSLKITTYWMGDTEKTSPNVCSWDNPNCKIFKTGEEINSSAAVCEIPTGTALNTSGAVRTCDVEIPETQLHFSQLQFDFSAPAGHACDVVYVYPYFYLASRSEKFFPSWLDSEKDCATLTSGRIDADCYSGPATQIEGFPRFTALNFPIRSKAVAFSETWKAESAFEKKRYGSNQWTAYQPNPLIPYDPVYFIAPDFTKAGSVLDIVGQTQNWRFQCVNHSSNLNYEYVLHIKPKKDTTTPGAPRFFGWTKDSGQVEFPATRTAGSNILQVSSSVDLSSLSSGQELSGPGFVSPVIDQINNTPPKTITVNDQKGLPLQSFSTGTSTYKTYGDSRYLIPDFNLKLDPTDLLLHEGPLEGDTQIFITTNSDLLNTSSIVQLGTSAINTKLCSSVEYLTPRLLGCKTPLAAVPSPLADVPVVVGLANSNFKLTFKSGLFTYKKLALTSLTGSGPVSGNTPLTITGHGIAKNAEVRIGFSDAPNCNISQYVNGGTSLTCTTPSLTSAGSYAFTVKNPTTLQEQSGTYTAFAPLISGVTIPAPGVLPLNPVAKTLTINGTFNTAGAPYSVTVGSATCQSPVSTSTQITCTLPSQAAAGTYGVTVKDNYNQSTTLDDAVKYVVPAISSVSPSTVPASFSGGISITGTFDSAAVPYLVSVGASSATPCSVLGGVTLACISISPALGTGMSYDVTVTDSLGQSVTLPNGITAN